MNLSLAEFNAVSNAINSAEHEAACRGMRSIEELIYRCGPRQFVMPLGAPRVSSGNADKPYDSTYNVSVIALDRCGEVEIIINKNIGD